MKKLSSDFFSIYSFINDPEELIGIQGPFRYRRLVSYDEINLTLIIILGNGEIFLQDTNEEDFDFSQYIRNAPEAYTFDTPLEAYRWLGQTGIHKLNPFQFVATHVLDALFIIALCITFLLAIPAAIGAFVLYVIYMTDCYITGKQP